MRDPLYKPAPRLLTSSLNSADQLPPAGKPTWRQPGDPVATVNDDFILLGSQRKFAPNVPYRLRRSAEWANRMRQLPPQPPTATSQQYVESEPSLVDEVTQTKNIPPPPVARTYTADENIQVTEQEFQHEADYEVETPPEAPRREKTPELVSEGIQVDENYAVKQRLGLVKRPGNARFQTEYSKQFNQPHPASAPICRGPGKSPHSRINSPIMDNETMFRRARSKSPNVMQPNVLFQTEYRRSFKPYQWQLHQKPQRRSLSAEGHEIMYEAQPQEIQRENLNQWAQKVKQLKMPKRFTSEYKSNFREPASFVYEDGAWKGSCQPQYSQFANAQPSVSGDSTWLAEVKELKERAKEYQLRNKGTHFTSKHVAQLVSDKAKLWDKRNEDDGGTRMALLDYVENDDQEEPMMNDDGVEVVNDMVQVDTLPTAEDLIRPAGLATKTRGTVQQSLEWAVQSNDTGSGGGDSCASSLSDHVAQDQQRNGLIIMKHQDVEDEDDQNQIEENGQSDQSSDSGVLPSAAGGRVRTSRMAVLQRSGDGSPRRHHLDITTPSVGGAILTSPPIKCEAKPRSTSRSNKTQPSSGYSSERATSPAFGKPTGDSHVLVQRDKPVNIHYHGPCVKQHRAQSQPKAPLKPPTIEQLILSKSKVGGNNRKVASAKLPVCFLSSYL